jgi:hypothetical protein
MPDHAAVNGSRNEQSSKVIGRHAFPSRSLKPRITRSFNRSKSSGGPMKEAHQAGRDGPRCASAHPTTYDAERQL